MADKRRLRPRGFDDLGLRRALGDRALPLLVAAMAFLAAISLAGAVAAEALAQHWREGAAAALTVQVPDPSGMVPATDDRAQEPRLARVVAILRETPGITYARPLAPGKLVDLLRPWLGSATDDPALPLPAVVEVRLAGEGPDLSPLSKQLEEAAPGTLLESHGVWVQRLSALARSVQTCAFLALGVVAAVSALVVAVATRAGLAARRESIEIVHGLGATDSYIAARFARRATMLAAIGGAAGALAALPVLLSLARLAAPFTASFEGPSGPSQWGWLATLPAGLWLALPALPAVAAAIGFITAQATVRRWLRRLP